MIRSCVVCSRWGSRPSCLRCLTRSVPCIVRSMVLGRSELRDCSGRKDDAVTANVGILAFQHDVCEIQAPGGCSGRDSSAVQGPYIALLMPVLTPSDQANYAHNSLDFLCGTRLGIPVGLSIVIALRGVAWRDRMIASFLFLHWYFLCRTWAS